MKRVFVAIGAVLSFAGLASLTLFFVMSPSSLGGLADAVMNWGGGNGAGGNSNVGLTADIGGVVTGGGAPTSVTSTIATDEAVASPAPTASEISTTSPESAAPATVAAPAPIPAPAPAASSVAAPEPAPAPAPALPEATTTIIVTPTAPLPPGAISGSAGTPAPDIASGGISLPYRENDFTGDARWQTTWGTLETTNTGALSLSAGANALGGAVHFTGGSWNGYAMSASLDLVAGQTFSLLANYVDASDYVFCEYDEAASGAIDVQLKQDVQGYVTAVSPVVTVPVSNGSGLVASIAVTGMYGTCSLNGVNVSNDGVGSGKSSLTAAQSGGIGFAVNDPSPHTSHIIVHEVDVTAR